MQALRRENEGLRRALINSQDRASLLERALRETRARLWEEREDRVAAEDDLREEDAAREATQQVAATVGAATAAEIMAPQAVQPERLRRLQAQRQRRTRRYQSEAQRRMNGGQYPRAPNGY